MNPLNTFDHLAMVQPKGPEDIRALLAELRAETAHLQAQLDKLAAACEAPAAVE